MNKKGISFVVDFPSMVEFSKWIWSNRSYVHWNTWKQRTLSQVKYNDDGETNVSNFGHVHDEMNCLGLNVGALDRRKGLENFWPRVHLIKHKYSSFSTFSRNKIISHRGDPGQACDFDGPLSTENYYISGSLLLPHFEYVFSFYPSRDQKRLFHFPPPPLFFPFCPLWFSSYTHTHIHTRTREERKSAACAVDFNGNTSTQERFVILRNVTKRYCSDKLYPSSLGKTEITGKLNPRPFDKSRFTAIATPPLRNIELNLINIIANN